MFAAGLKFSFWNATRFVAVSFSSSVDMCRIARAVSFSSFWKMFSFRKLQFGFQLE